MALGLNLGGGGIFSEWDIIGLIGSNDPRENELRNFIKQRYSSKDCFALDVNIKEAKDSLAYLKAEKLNGYKMTLSPQPKLIKESFSVFYNYMTKKASDFYKKNTNINTYYGSFFGDKLLPEVIKKLENVFVDGDCRNKIEQTRLDESGSLLTKQSAVSEANVLPSNYKEQYLYIGLGSVVLLVGLYIIAKK
jgi:hypothetical protein